MVNTEFLPVRAGKPSRRDRFALAERDDQVYRMAAEGYSYSQIAERFGYSGTGSVANCIKRVRESYRTRSITEHKAEQRATIEALKADAWRDLHKRAYKVNNTGLVVMACKCKAGAIEKPCEDDPDGIMLVCPQCGMEPIRDLAVKNEARTSLIRLLDREITLEGTSAPKQSVHLTGDLDAAIRAKAAVILQAAGRKPREEIENVVDAEVVPDD
jgi:hypothetical protein